MSPYPNLPPEPRFTQGIVDQFNADARRWKKLRAPPPAAPQIPSSPLEKEIENVGPRRIRPGHASAGLHRPTNETVKKNSPPRAEIITTPVLERRLLTIRGQKTILDADLAEIDKTLLLHDGARRDLYPRVAATISPPNSPLGAMSSSRPSPMKPTSSTPPRAAAWPACSETGPPVPPRAPALPGQLRAEPDGRGRPPRSRIGAVLFPFSVFRVF